jgi:hypothetical protein
MKKGFDLLLALSLLVIFCSYAGAQIPPPGAGDKSLEDRSVKGRSTELERIKRDANKPEPVSKETQARQFSEIKEDFEQIQHSQNGIADAYTKSKTIDYEKIAANADKLNASGKRLMGNLFPQTEIKKGNKKTEMREAKSESPVAADIKTLIVDLDNSLLAFISNPVFTNPQVTRKDDNLKAKSDLEKILRLSSALKIEADKQRK